MVAEKLLKHEIVFDEPTHTYTVKGVSCISVTTLLDHLSEPFNEHFWAKKCAENPKHEFYGVDPENIKIIWKEKNNKAKERGRLFHLFAEAVIKGEDHTGYSVPPELRKEFIGYWEGIQNGFEKEKFQIVGLEQRLAMPSLNIAGTTDALFQMGDYGLFVYDWKTNEKFTDRERYYLPKPFEKFDKSKLTFYTFQAYAYKYMLEEEYGIETAGARIVWLNEEHGVVSYKPKFKYDRTMIKTLIEVCSERYYKTSTL